MVYAGLIAAENLLPEKMANIQPSHQDEILEYYGVFLTAVEKMNFQSEVDRWSKYCSEEVNPRLFNCHRTLFPVIKIFLTVPIGSVPCEQSFSALRRLKVWTRSSMTEERLCGLALMSTHRHSKYIPSAQQIFDQKTNWRGL